MDNNNISKYRSEVIEKAINIEWIMSAIICQHYFKKTILPFLLEVLYDEYFSFALKRRILEKIVKDETLVTCDNKECEYRGEMFWCYLSQEKKCGIYLEYNNGDRKV